MLMQDNYVLMDEGDGCTYLGIQLVKKSTKSVTKEYQHLTKPALMNQIIQTVPLEE
jgi:hypothetical protein